MNRSLLAVASSIAVCTGHALAETYWVTSLADSGTGSLRTAIGQANSHLGPDEVVFHPSLSGILDLSTEIFVTSPLTIVGPPSRAVTIRSAGGIFRLDASVIESATEFGMFDLTMTAASAVIYGQIEAVGIGDAAGMRNVAAECHHVHLRRLGPRPGRAG